MSLLLALTNAAGIISVALTGQEITFSDDSLFVAIDKAVSSVFLSIAQQNLSSSLGSGLSTQFQTISVGSLAANYSLAVSSLLQVYVQENIVPAFQKSVSGSAESIISSVLTSSSSLLLSNLIEGVASGTLGKSSSFVVIGQSETSTQQAISTLLSAGILGQSYSDFSGTVTPSQGAVLQPTGILQTYVQQSLTPVFILQVTPSVIAESSGSLAAVNMKTLSSIAESVLAGTVSPVIFYALQLTGLQYALQQSQLLANTAAQPSSVNISASQGVMASQFIRNVQGQQIATATSNITSAISSILNGENIDENYGQLLSLLEAKVNSILLSAESGSISAVVYSGIVSALRTLTIANELRKRIIVEEDRQKIQEIEQRALLLINDFANKTLYI
jgi:hypothetical protein